MATNNGWNAAYLAGTAQAIAGTETRSVINPASLQGALDVTRQMLPCYENLGISKSGSTFSITSANGSALSSTNYAKITLPSNVSLGTLKSYTITNNRSFIDATGASTIIGNTFGTTTGVAWSSAMPFFLYCGASSTDTNPIFFISRMPCLLKAPSAANIGQSGSAIANNEYSIFALSAITAADYAGSALMYMGCFEMTSKNTSNDWTVSALTATDGLSKTKDRFYYTYPSGQRGATAGKFILDNGGTAPDFATSVYSYNIETSGTCRAVCYLDNVAGGVAGVGAVTSFLTAPFTAYTIAGISEYYAPAGFYIDGGTSRSFLVLHQSNGTMSMVRGDNGDIIINSKLEKVDRRIGCNVTYKVYIP